jgi:hypothetical protein
MPSAKGLGWGMRPAATGGKLKRTTALKHTRRVDNILARMLLSGNQDSFAPMSKTTLQAVPELALPSARGALLLVLPVRLLLTRSKRCGALANA